MASNRLPSGHRPSGPRLLAALAVTAALTVPAGGALRAQDAEPDTADALDPAITTEAYLTPPSEVADAVLAPRWENVLLRSADPSGRYFLHTVEDGLPPLSRFAKRHHNLGALQIDPTANRHRRLTTRSDAGYEIWPADGGDPVTVDVPEGARVSGATWSPEGDRFAFLAHFDDATHVYVADAATGDARRVTRTPVLATLVTGVEWTGDGQRIATVLVPEDRGAEPATPSVPETPMVRLTTDEENRLRTYFDLLEDPHEKELVRYYTTGQLALVDVESRDVRRVGEPAMIDGIDVSPDGEYLEVTRVTGELPYIVPVSSSAEVQELWDLEGNVLAVLDERDVRDGGDSDDDDGEDGPEKRGLTWRVDGPGMVFLQMEPREEEEEAGEEPTAEEEEDAEEEDEPRMDRVMAWLPPFDSTSTEVLYQTEDRIDSFRFDATGRTLFLTRRSGSGDNGRERLTAVFLDDEEREEHEIYSHRRSDHLSDPGSLVGMSGPRGVYVVRTTPDGESVFLTGTQYFEDPTEDAPRPFLDRVEIRTGEKERIFQSGEDVYESVAEVLDPDGTRVVTVRQAPTVVPDSWLRDLEAGTETRLTSNVDHTPDITSARREIVMIERPDGFTSKVEVTLPVGYREGQPAPPGMFWFYPREYTDQEDYEESNLERYNKNSFRGIGTRSMEILTRLGYTVVDPDLPIVGESGQMNNNYVQDLRNTLYTVIDSLDARGWIDRDRLGIGGHSYGAFGTVNAMVNTPFFKAGIAGDGNYNRSLTPAGFQREPRLLWEADQIYIEMSPFFKADQLTGALLMYHGMDDHNVGTHPTHSKRLFHALNVLGKKASLYMYPFEDHGPATRETTLDLWARWSAWLDEYVKNHGADEEGAVTDDAEQPQP